jgi:hypothetical protein
MTLGSAIHCLTLEPDTFEERFYHGKASPSERRTRLTDGQWGEARFLATLLREHPYAANIANAIIENPVEVGTHIGLTLKCMPDMLLPGRIVDLKTTSFPPGEWDDNAIRLGYHVQAAFYWGVLQQSGDHTAKDFTFWTICTREPYSVFLRTIPNNELANAWRNLCLPTLRKLSTFLDSGSNGAPDDAYETQLKLRKRDLTLQEK